MTISTRLSEKEYINASFASMFAGRLAKIYLIVIVFVILINIISGKSGTILSTLLPVIIIVTVFGAMMYLNLKKAYRNNTGASENIVYTFTDDLLEIKGESFKTELALKKIKKVTGGGKWILIWQNKYAANVIPKAAVDEATLAELKDILDRNAVKNNL